MALAANKQVIEQGSDLVSYPMAAVKIFKGALLKINAAGFLAPAAPEAGSQFAGIAYEEKDNSAGVAGAIECRAMVVNLHVCTGAGFVQADVGSQVFATDDDTVTLTEGTTSKQKVGKIVRLLSSTEVLVKIEPFTGIGASA